LIRIAQRGIFDGDGLVAAEEESDEPDNGEKEFRHLYNARFHLVHYQLVTLGRNNGEPQLQVAFGTNV